MKSFMRGLAVAALLFAGAAAAEAQINFRADVDVPFDFNIGGKSHDAGRYTVKINKQMAVGGAALTIQRIGSNHVQTILMANGTNEPSEDVQLIFNSVGGKRYLTGVKTATNGFELIKGDIFDARLARSKTKDKGRSTQL